VVTLLFADSLPLCVCVNCNVLLAKRAFVGVCH